MRNKVGVAADECLCSTRAQRANCTQENGMAHASLRQLMIREYGAVVGGRDLRSALGFKSTAAFCRAVRYGYVPLRIFEMPGRRGRFALVSDIADWLENSARKGVGRKRAGRRRSRREGAKM